MNGHREHYFLPPSTNLIQITLFGRNSQPRHRNLGTHNSYHRKSFLRHIVQEWNYEHATLDRQLDLGVRGLEIDIHPGPGRIMVYHVQLWDDRTTCFCLHTCLETIKLWMLDHPLHSPIFVYFEAKRRFWEDRRAGIHGFHGWSDVAAAIQDVFHRDDLVKPSDVQRDFGSLQAAVDAVGWPTLQEVRGKIVFVAYGRYVLWIFE